MDGKAKWMYLLIENDELKNNDIWNKVSNSINKENNKFLKTKMKALQ